MRLPVHDARDHVPVIETERPFGPNKQHMFVICDDGVAYQYEKFADDRRWSLVARWDGDERVAEPSRVAEAPDTFVRNWADSRGEYVA